MNASADAHGDFEISREFAAPRELVWRAWTELDHLMRWFGPKGFTMPVAKLDLRPGGTFLYGMHAPDGSMMWGKWTFREIVAPERLVLISSFSDEGGGITRHPLSPTWPLEMLATTTFVEHEGRTTVTVRWRAHDATPAEQATFDASHDSMRGGWGGTFARLEAFLGGEQAA